MISKTTGFRGLAYFQTHPDTNSVKMLPGSQSLRGAPMSSAGEIWLQTRPGGWPAPERGRTQISAMAPDGHLMSSTWFTSRNHWVSEFEKIYTRAIFTITIYIYTFPPSLISPLSPLNFGPKKLRTFRPRCRMAQTPGQNMIEIKATAVESQLWE